MSYFIYQEKRIYYSESGKGNPVVFLHGNTASSRMFEVLLPLYEEHFKVILLDFLGHGRSDRLSEFPAGLWQEEARQIIALLEHLDYGKVSLVGSSGGAWAAVNAGLLRPDLVGKVVADSFDGRTLGEDFARKLLDERAGAKQDEQAVGFYQWCQGEDWERIVDMDTKALVQCAEENLPLFFKPISELEVPLLLMGSAGDEMVRTDIRDEYEAISGKTGAEICMFSSGGHPAIYSNAERAAEAIRQFLSRADVRKDCNEIVIRPLKPEEYSVLEDFLYDAIYLPEGAAAPPKEIINQPELAVYITDFGQADDLCLVAEAYGHLLGAVWTRILAGKIKGYGNVDEHTPEFAISVKKEFRQQGIGSKLMQEMIVLLKSKGYEKVSLSVNKDNYAYRMYQKQGFHVIQKRDEDNLMVLELKETTKL